MSGGNCRRRSSETPGEEPLTGSGLSSGFLQFVLITGGLVLAVLIAKLFLDQYQLIQKLSKRLEDERVITARLREKVRSLEKEVDFLATEDGIERTARERLRMVGNGEIIMVPLDLEKSQKVAVKRPGAQAWP